MPCDVGIQRAQALLWSALVFWSARRWRWWLVVARWLSMAVLWRLVLELRLVLSFLLDRLVLLALTARLMTGDRR